MNDFDETFMLAFFNSFLKIKLNCGKENGSRTVAPEENYSLQPNPNPNPNPNHPNPNRGQFYSGQLSGLQRKYVNLKYMQFSK